MSIRLRRSLTLLSIPFTAWLYPQLKSEAPHPNQKQCRQKVASTSRVVRQGVRIPSRSTESLVSKPLLTTHTYVFQSVTVSHTLLCLLVPICCLQGPTSQINLIGQLLQCDNTGQQHLFLVLLTWHGNNEGGKHYPLRLNVPNPVLECCRSLVASWRSLANRVLLDTLRAPLLHVIQLTIRWW